MKNPETSCPSCRRSRHAHKDLPGGVDYQWRYIMEMADGCLETSADFAAMDATLPRGERKS